MEMDENYDVPDPFVNARLFRVTEDMGAPDAEAAFEAAWWKRRRGPRQIPRAAAVPAPSPCRRMAGYRNTRAQSVRVFFPARRPGGMEMGRDCHRRRIVVESCC